MARPPKRINPQAHKTADRSGGRAFRKGRYPTVKPGEPATFEGEEPTVVDAGTDETRTVNAAFTSPSSDRPGTVIVPTAAARDAEADAKYTETQDGSKYTTRPVAGHGPADDAPDTVVDLRRSQDPEVVVDLSKLPPVDESQASETRYVRRSDGWPVTGA